MNGINNFFPMSYTPQQNVYAERRHRHICEIGLTLLSQAGLPKQF